MKASAFAGFVAGAAIAGASALSLVHFSSDRSSGSASAPSTSAGRVNPVANSGTDNARNVYSGAKNSVAYISAETDQGTATGSGFVVSSDGGDREVVPAKGRAGNGPLTARVESRG